MSQLLATTKEKIKRALRLSNLAFFMFFDLIYGGSVSLGSDWSGFIKEPFVSSASRQSKNVIKFLLSRTFHYGLRGRMINLHGRDALNYAECQMRTAVDNTDGNTERFEAWIKNLGCTLALIKLSLYLSTGGLRGDPTSHSSNNSGVTQSDLHTGR